MSSDAALAFAGLWLTYLIRSSGAYLLLCMLCRLIQNSYLRFRFTKVYESNGRFTKVYIGEGGGRFTKVHEANGDTLLVPQQDHRADRGQNDPMTLADLARKLGVNPRTTRSWTWSRAQQAQLSHLRIPFTKLGNTLWFSPAKIDIWLQQLGNAPPALAAVKGKQKDKRG